MSKHSSGRDIEKAEEITETTEYHDSRGSNLNGNAINSIRRPSRVANPTPAGTFSFAATTWLLAMYNLHTRGVQVPNVIIGMALFGGGLIQFMAGMWEFPRGNVFGATVFTMYGGFWFSYATIFIPGSGVMAAYDGTPDQLANALGLYLIVWFMITVMFISTIFRRNTAFTVTLSSLALSLLMLSITQFTGSATVAKAGGVFGITTGLCAFYIGWSELLAAEETAFVRLPLGARAT